ncbi:hypothetical protein DRP05_10630 [Archaeoglobales archaeon]|nr:MAG: hypothetical protein DRO97_06330 [Archaeoglobales archaeon]RLI77303.1 MAG: hypothetical protein DRP05_10630 [Archaeoglobales archaeon]
MFGKTFKIDSSGDLVINELKRIEIVEELEKVAQDVSVILKTVKGSYPFDPDFGVDYIKIVESGFNRMQIEDEIKKALNKYPYLKSIDSIEISDPDKNRRIVVNLRLTVISGESISLEVTI